MTTIDEAKAALTELADFAARVADDGDGLKIGAPDARNLSDRLRTLLSSYDEMKGRIEEAVRLMEPFGQYASRWDKHTDPFPWRGQMYPAEAAVVHVDSTIKVPVADHNGEKEAEAPRKPGRRVTIGDFRRAASFVSREKVDGGARG